MRMQGLVIVLVGLLGGCIAPLPGTDRLDIGPSGGDATLTDSTALDADPGDLGGADREQSDRELPDVTAVDAGFVDDAGLVDDAGAMDDAAPSDASAGDGGDDASIADLGPSDGTLPPDAAGDAGGGFDVARELSPPTATIGFPPARSLTEVDHIVVRGIASDASPIRSLSINGVAATSVDGFIHWTATVPLAPGSNALQVSAEDIHGNVASAAARASIERSPNMLRIPVALTTDAGGTHAYVVDTEPSQILAVDLTTGARTIVADNNRGGGEILRSPMEILPHALSGQLLYLDSGVPGLMSVELSTGNRAPVSGPRGTGPAFGQLRGAALRDAARALVLDETAGLLEVDLVSGDRRLISGMGPTLMFPRKIALRNINQALLTDAMQGVLSVDLTTGNRTVISSNGVGSGPSFSFPQAIAVNAAGTTAYVADIVANSVISVSLTNGNRTILSGPGVGTGPPLFGVRGLSVDTAGQRLVVVDAALDAVVAISLNNGNRTILSGHALGAGPPAAAPLGILWDRARGRLLGTDRWAAASIFSVRPSDGDRALISDVGNSGQGPAALFTSPIWGATPDEIIGYDDNGVLLVAANLTTGNRRVIGDRFDPAPAFSSVLAMAYDTRRSRVLLYDSVLSAVIAADPMTRQHGTVSSNSGVGSGPMFGAVTGLLESLESPDRFLAIDLTQNQVLALALPSGDRSLYSGAAVGAGPSIQGPTAMALDPNQEVLFVLDAGDDGRGRILSIASSGDRTEISSSQVGSGPRLGREGMTFSPTTGLIYTAPYQLGAIVAVDPITGERVLLSH